MFGRVRASASSLDSLEGSPSKILKDDSFSIYEATLMKLKLGAKRDTPEEVRNDCSVNSQKVNMDTDSTPIETASSSNDDDEITLMDTDTDTSCITTSHTSYSDGVSPEITEPSEQPSCSNVSILHFFKVKDSGPVTVSSSCREQNSTKNGSFGSVSISSPGSVESNCTNETESALIFQDCELSE